jgi:hypothetical protein
LSDAGSFTEIGLTPTKHGPTGPNLSGEQMLRILSSVRPNIRFRGFVAHGYIRKKKSPAEGPPGIIDFIPRSSDQGRKSR